MAFLNSGGCSYGFAQESRPLAGATASGLVITRTSVFGGKKTSTVDGGQAGWVSLQVRPRAAAPGVRSLATSFGDPKRIHSGNSYTDWLGT